MLPYAIFIFSAVVVILIFRRWIASTRRTAAAFNVLLGKYTYLLLPTDKKNEVKNRAREILHQASGGRIDEFNGEIEMYGWYALAMNELGIRPAVEDYPKWNTVSNPFAAILPGDPALESVAHYIKATFGVAVSVSPEHKLYDSIFKDIHRE